MAFETDFGDGASGPISFATPALPTEGAAWVARRAGISTCLPPPVTAAALLGLTLDATRRIDIVLAPDEGLVDPHDDRLARQIFPALLDTSVTLVLGVAVPALPPTWAETAGLRILRGVGRALSRKAGYHVVLAAAPAGSAGCTPASSLSLMAATLELCSGRRLGPDFGLAALSAAGPIAGARPCLRASDRRAAESLRSLFGATPLAFDVRPLLVSRGDAN